MDILDTHMAIVGTTGVGKTVTAKVQVEALLDAGRHVCIIDPTGAWSGLRSNAAGDGPGFPIPIFGGLRGDVSIAYDQGKAIGGIIADGVSGIVDISELRTGQHQRQFVRDLLRALRTKPSGQFHLVVDEADEFASQKPRDDYGFQAGEELIWIAKRGRLAGFVMMLITQRPASIDKEVLTQAQTVIAHQLIAPVDQRPILDYLRDNADKATLALVKGSLATLAKGEHWIYAPRQGLLERRLSPMPRSFDSSRTPGPGETPAAPKMLAEIDLGEIRAKLAPVEAAKAAQIQIIANDSVPLSHETVRLRARVAELEAERDEWITDRALGQQQLDEVIAERNELRRLIGEFTTGVSRVMVALDDRPLHGTDLSLKDIGREMAVAKVAIAPKPAPPAKSAGHTSPGLTPALQRVLDAIKWWSAIGVHPVERNRASVIAGLSPKASTFGVYVSKLVQMGMVTTPEPGKVGLTPDGSAAANSPGEVAKSDVAAQARSMLKPAAANVFDYILAAHPDWIDRGTLADQVGLSRTASTLGVYISESSKLGFVETSPGKVRIADWLMP